MTAPPKPADGPRLHYCEPGELFEVGVWRAVSAEVAPQIAHSHGDVLKAAEKALRRVSGLGAEDIRAARYVTPSGRIYRCFLLSRVGLVATFDYLHNVPGCRDIEKVLWEYHRLFDLQAAQPAPAAPAPDSEIRPPDPEPTLEPSDRARTDAKPESWEINYAIEIIQRSDMPEHLKLVNKTWNDDRLEALFAEAKSWTEAEELYATENPKRRNTR